MRRKSMRKVFAAVAVIVLLVPFSIALHAGAEEEKTQNVQQKVEEKVRKFEEQAVQKSKEELKGLMEADTLKEELEAARKAQKTDKEKTGKAQIPN